MRPDTKAGLLVLVLGFLLLASALLTIDIALRL